jgi:tRNA G10  N-methylase Trm11
MKIFITLLLFISIVFSADYKSDIIFNEYNKDKIFKKLIEDKYFNEGLVIYYGNIENTFKLINKYQINKNNPDAFFIFNENWKEIGNNINYLTSLGIKFIIAGKETKEDIILTQDFFITNNKIYFKENNKFIYNEVEKKLKEYYFNKWKG